MIYFHATCMTAAFVLLVVGVGIAVGRRRNKRWLDAHKKLGTLSPLLVAVGLVIAYLAVASYSDMHFTIPHAWFGLLTAAAVVATQSMGVTILRKRGGIRLRATHRWMGRMSLVMMFLMVVSGLMLLYG